MPPSSRHKGIVMKSLSIAGLTCLVLVMAVWLAPGQVNSPTKISWNGNLVTIEWTEPLVDPKAAKDEVPFIILTGPYIGWLTPTEATVGWEVIAEKRVTESPYASLPAKYPDANIQFRSVRLTDLKPDTLYRYQLKSGNYQSKIITFRTFPAPDATSFKFAMVGDTQRGEVPASAAIESKLFADILAWNPTLLIHLGDMLGTGRGDGLNGRKAWFRTLTRNRETRGSVFMAPTAGNHCWLGSGHGWCADYLAGGKGPPAQIRGGSPPR